MKPICVKCQRFYKPKKTGTYFIEGMPTIDRALPGTLQPSAWVPYKLWAGDLYECEGCNAEIIVGTGYQPVSIQHEPDFVEKASLLNAKFQVNDC